MRAVFLLCSMKFFQCTSSNFHSCLHNRSCVMENDEKGDLRFFRCNINIITNSCYILLDTKLIRISMS